METKKVNFRNEHLNNFASFIETEEVQFYAKEINPMIKIFTTAGRK